MGLEMPNDPLFPLQSVIFGQKAQAQRAYQHLLRQGVWAMLQNPSTSRERPALLFVLTARHTFQQIDHALAAMRRATS
jgi:7-keto-8-aminopelargonate synthetase-like enzyme